MELVNQLVNTLGISEEQAKGGAGLLFRLAKEKLGASEFGEIGNAVPQVEELISAAPGGSGGLLGTIGNLASSLGGSFGGTGNVASLAAGFGKLGLDSNMVGQFIPVVLSFLQQQGGDGLRILMQRVLKTG